MRASEIRAMVIPSPLEINDTTTLALAYQQTKCVLLREICAQLADQSEALRQLLAKDWVNAVAGRPNASTLKCDYCEDAANFIVNGKTVCDRKKHETVLQS